MRHASTLTAAGLLAAVTLTACTSSSDTQTDPAPRPSTAATTAAPIPSPTPTRYTLGQPWRWSNSTGASGTTTVLGYQQPVLRDDPPGVSLGVPAGSQWGRLDVRVCQTAGPSIGVSQTPWSLAFPDGSRAETTGLSGGNFPKPEWPIDAAVQPGECVRGGIMFPIPKGQRPTRVIYAPESAPSPTEWDIPAK